MAEAEGVALRVAADGPPPSRVDDLAAQLGHAAQSVREVGDGEVGQRGAVARARSALVQAEHERTRFPRLKATALALLSLFEARPEQAFPEAPGALDVVGRELDQRGSEIGHVLSLEAVELGAHESERPLEPPPV
jgi:hypothetical protein